MPNIRELTIDEILKLKAVVLYVITKCNEIDYFHLFKILYFADKEHYARYGRRIICDTFCALPKGPVPSFLFDAVKVATNQPTTNRNKNLNVISDALWSPDPSYYFILSAKEKPDMEELSKSDIELLDKSINENRNTDIESLSNKSHDEAWTNAWNKQKAYPIDPILMAKSAGANEDMIEYIKENELLNSLAY